MTKKFNAQLWLKTSKDFCHSLALDSSTKNNSPLILLKDNHLQLVVNASPLYAVYCAANWGFSCRWQIQLTLTLSSAFKVGDSSAGGRILGQEKLF